MIDKFGQVMVYVKDPRAVADFWITKVGFIEKGVTPSDTGTLCVEIAPNNDSDTSLVLFDRLVVEQAEPKLSLGTPSILFSSYNLEETRTNLQNKGVNVGEIIEMQNQKTFNFSDIEGNYFAIREVKKM